MYFEDNTFDVVTTYQTLEHVQDVAACIDELIRVAKPGG
ncbi:methyltransferase domain-containing protein [Aeromonas veronii]